MLFHFLWLLLYVLLSGLETYGAHDKWRGLIAIEKLHWPQVRLEPMQTDSMAIC